MAKVLFKKGPSQSFDTDKDLNSIIFKKSTNPQAPGFSEIYLGDNRCGVGHNFSIGSDGLVPAPTMADIGKVLTPNGWIDLSKISGSDNVKQVGIESSTTLYPILLKGTTGASDYTGQVNFTSTVNQNTPLLSASPDGHLICKSLDAIEGNIGCVLGDINLMDMPVMSGGHSLNLVSSVNSSTESSPSILLARSTSLGTTTDQYTNWRIQNAANGVLTFTPEKTGGSETPFVSVLSNVTATSFTVSGASSADTYIKADGSGYGGAFTGAGEAAGTAGLVPAPAIGDAGKYLKGDGTWGEIQGGVQSDWEEDDSTDLSYVQNRPAVRAGTGTNAVIGGDIANNVASGQYSHAEGTNTKSLGDGSHAEGYGTIAAGGRSHAEGFGYAHNTQYYPDSIFKLTGAANDAFYSADTLDGAYERMGLYYNGVWAVVEEVAEIEGINYIFTDKTLDPNNALNNTTVKIVTGYASDLAAHVEGTNSIALGNASHAEGSHTVARNIYEHAQGQFNKSNSKRDTGGQLIKAESTLHSIGIGTSDSDRKNAVEVMQNGDVYVYGVGDYDGTNPGVADTLQDAINNASMDLATPVTYSELVTLKTGGNLVPGMQYRITDYHTTVSPLITNVRSADHQFDVIVRADDANHLNENARAAIHEGDVYFADCNLEAWELQYHLDNENWSRVAGTFIEDDSDGYLMRKLGTVDVGGNTYILWDASEFTEDYGITRAVSEDDEVGTELKGYDPETGEILGGWSAFIASKFDVEVDGQGTILMLKDEYGNQCPYDFKSIQFKRWAVTDSQQGRDGLDGKYMGVLNGVPANISIDDEDNFIWAYTFSSDATGSEEQMDFSLNGTHNVYDNVFEMAPNVPNDLNDVVFYGENNYGNRLGVNCYRNTFGNNCGSNSFGNDCNINSFGNGCFQNTFGNNCRGNSFGNGCYYNSFENNCQINSFSIGCISNSFGNGCYRNSFGNNCQFNSFGNGCNINSFGNFCNNNSFGNYYNNNSFGNYCQTITVFDGVRCCNITGGTQQSRVKNAQILNDTAGASDQNKLTITFAANKNYTQVAGLVNGTDLRIWIAEDTVTGPSSAGNNSIAVFDGTTGKIIKDSGVRVFDILTDLATPVTYDELVDLITGEMLVPGMKYRITDYDCTTTQENTTSAGNVFDIIVTADSETKLNENARAAHHEGYPYFANCDLGAWELKYSIYNDKNKFSWADCNYVAASEIQKIKPEAEELFALPEAANILQNYWQETISTYTSGAQVAFFASDSGPSETIFRFSNDGGASLSSDLFITIPTKSFVYSNSLLTIKCGNLEYKIHLGEIDDEIVSETTNGKGVIYYMKDELGNECPYDFKNIMFKRWAVSEVTDSKMTQESLEKLNDLFVFDGGTTTFQTRFGYQGRNCNYGSTVHVVNSNDYGWYYTFSVTMKDVDRGEHFLNDIEDGSIKGNNYYHDGDAGGFYGNTIMPRYDNMASDEDGIDGAQVLNNIVLNGYYEYLGSGNETYTLSIYGCNNNRFGYNCYLNTFGNNCGNNSFGNNCYTNSFSCGSCYNSFGNSCQRNSIGNDFGNNSFGDNCYSNSLVGDGCYYNSFGNSCRDNTFGYGCNSNSFGNNCYGNTFGDHCEGNSLGNNYKGNSFGNRCQYITVFDNVQYCSVTGGSQSAPVKNAQILNGTKGTSFQNKLTISFAANKSYTQVAGLVNGTDLRIWIAEDTVTGPSSVVNNRIAVFDGTTGKIIKDSGYTIQGLIEDVPGYTIEKLNQAETGYSSSYVLKKDDVQVGATINIPKDMVVSSGEVKTVTTANVPYQGAQVGDKYIDLTIANSSSQHIYIPVKDLVDVYQAGNGISIDASNYISVKIDSANANGLATTTAGLKLDTVTTTTNGAMTATDKVKLDSINGNYWGSQTLSAAASYITTPEFQQVTINGDPTATQASTDHCVMVYDTTNKCLKFTF